MKKSLLDSKGIRLALYSFLLLGSGGIKAQEYSTAVEFVQLSDKILTVQSVGMASSKSDAKTMAVKSVFHTLFNVGLPEVNDGRPMVGKSNSYYMNKFMNDRYSMFIQETRELSKPEKTASGAFKSLVEVDILINSLIRDLKAEKLFNEVPKEETIKDVDEKTQIPSIIVLPYKKSDQTYREVIQSSPEKRTVMVSVQEAFSMLGVIT